ncbi:MAG: hypothetical protein QNJ45_14205 [Ardenticatenaceae bacterium]|nr:hypothetical protein [Ardenticatenaceae bacterium]
MGTDIHLHIEYRSNKYDKYRLFASDFQINRDYALFGALAGLGTEKEPLIPPRGLPKDISNELRYQPFIPVTQVTKKKLGFLPANIVCLDELDEPYYQGSRRLEMDGKVIFVSDPDKHTSSWLTLTEIYACLDYHELKIESCVYNLRLLLDLMDGIKSTLGPEPRIVFWFDS